MNAGWALAFAAGILAAFNPCGFALLPSYAAMFLDGRRGSRGVARALSVSAWVTVGFVVTFGVMGVAVTWLSVRFGEWLSWLTMAMGVVLVVSGTMMLAGRSTSVRIPRLTLAVDSHPVGLVSYGFVYATVSLSCTLPVFLAVVATSFTQEDVWAGSVSFVAYAMGMGAVMAVVAIASAVAGARTSSRARAAGRYARRISSTFLILAGLYVTWYGWVELRSFRGAVVTEGPTAWVSAASSTVTRWLSSLPVWAVAAACASVVIVALVLARRQRRAGDGTSTHITDPAKESSTT
ncbi:MAG: cytochrome c biogenesis CcdA family protein [Dehalococcoidia bacterium]